jgi:hypothetical protein
MYTQGTTYSILINGVKIIDTKLIAVNLCKLGELSDELVLLDSEMTKEVFIKKYKDKYDVDTIMAVLILMRKDYGYQTEKE